MGAWHLGGCDFNSDKQLFTRKEFNLEGGLIIYYITTYACAPSSYDTLQVRVTRVVSFSGKELIHAVDDYKLKSGTWGISVIFYLPKDLESGEYILNTTV